jgi:hypothetical protein
MVESVLRTTVTHACCDGAYKVLLGNFMI